MTTCPNVADLRHYLDDALPPEAEATLVGHVDSCPDCRQRLDHLSNDGGLSLASLRLPAPAVAPACLERLRQRPPAPPRPEHSTRLRMAALQDTRHTLPLSGALRDTQDGPPLRLGAYEILEELGRGGMGVVYLARDTRLNRQVALKMIRGSALDDLENQSRFLTEAQAIAQLKHPHIVQLLEMGTLEGRLYFALEYVPGGSLAKRLDKGLLSPTDTAALLEQLARAVEHAHQQGIVHRDLKPANVLLQMPNEECRMKNDKPNVPSFDIRHSSFGIAKITDFGLAKRLDVAESLTQTGIIVGTPSYMAPEQALAEKTQVGPAVDIYSLGAILYECLTGRPPFLAPSALETLEAAQTQEPVPPSRWQLHTPRDLETICLKCLHKEPARRYPTAAALAEDLGRYLRGEPILARPVPTHERLVRWCRRNPLATTFLATLAAATLGMVGLAWWAVDERNRAAEHAQRADQHARAAAAQARLTEEKRQEAVQQRQEADKQRQEALTNLEHARKAVDECFRLAETHPLFQGEAQRSRRILLLERAKPFYEQFARQRSDDVHVLAGQVEILWKLGYIYDEVGPWQKAMEVQQQAIAAYERLIWWQPQTYKWQIFLAVAWSNHGTLHHRQGMVPKALECFAKAEKLQHQLITRHHRKLTSEQRLKVQADLARTWHNQAVQYRDLRQLAQALAFFSKAGQLQQRLCEAHPHVIEFQASLATTLNNLSTVYLDQRRFPEALDYHQQAMRAWEKLAAGDPQRLSYQQEIAHVWQGLGSIHTHQGQPHKAIHAYTQAKDRLEKLLAQQPEVINHPLLLGATCCNLANLLQAQGDWRQAAAVYRQARTVLRQLRAREPREHRARGYLGNVHLGQAILLSELQRHTAALPEWRRGAEMAEGLFRERRWGGYLACVERARPEQASFWGLASALAGHGGTPAVLGGHLGPWFLWLAPLDE